MRRRRLILLQAGVLGTALLLAAAPAAVGAGSPTPVPAVVPTLPEVAPAVLPPTVVQGSTAPKATPRGVAAALGPLLASPALGRVLAVVTDPADGTVLYDSGKGATSAPASTLKVLTAVTALVALGVDTRLRTRVVRQGRTLTLVGAGDDSLTRTPGRLGATPTASMEELARLAAAALKGAGSSTTGFTLHYDDSLFTGPRISPNWSAALLAAGEVAPVTALSVDGGRAAPHSPVTSSDPPLVAARDLASRLRRLGVALTGDVVHAVAPAGATELAAVSSPPVVALVEHTLTESDDDMAESLAHLAGGKLGGAASFAGGATATTKVLTSLGVPVAGLAITDGSGLARSDRLEPATLTGALTAVATARAPEGLAVTGVPTWGAVTGLPVAGFTGTLAQRFLASGTFPARGVVRAKTGTLTGVQALAGVVRDRDGRLLTFAFLTSGVPVKERAQDALDRASAALASCGCR